MSQEVAIDPKMRQSWKSRNENPWLNGLGLEEADLNELRGIQNTYVVQLDQYPIFGYAWYIWLLWDHDRLWGRFNFGNTEGIFLVDPGVKPSLCDEVGGQELLFTWRGVQNLKPNIFYSNELITKGKIRIYPRIQKIEGFFEYMDGDGCPGEKPGDKCAFHAEGYSSHPWFLIRWRILWSYGTITCHFLQKRKGSVSSYLHQKENLTSAKDSGSRWSPSIVK